VVKVFVRHRQQRGTEFDSRYLQNLNFEFLNFLEVLGHPGQYIDTFLHEIPSATWFSGCSIGLLIVRFSVQSCGGRIAGLDQPREASQSGYTRPVE
jgi:hypothetical protein